MHVAKRTPIVVVRGEGVRVWDDTGKAYYDMVGGWAVNTLGHASPVMCEALQEQAASLIHTSNQFFTVPQLELAKLLTDNSPLDRVFFSNSGAEANEGAVKLARKWGKLRRNGAYEVITADHSFHGRTLAMVAATGKPAYQKIVEPLPAGFVTVPYDDIEAIRRATTDRTVAIMLEPVQGEGGVNIPSRDYFPAVRKWCDEQNLLLICDEVQTGVCRLGTLWGHQQWGIEPDVMTLAKGLGGGVPIGAILVKNEHEVFEPGDHGSTYGGNPLCCAVALAVMREVLRRDLAGHVRRVGEHLMARLRELQARTPAITQVRGLGLLIAVQFDRDIAAAVQEAATGVGLLLNVTNPDLIRLMPPLTITEEEADAVVDLLGQALEQVAAAPAR
ncbi:MAG: aspartate aminotransferase family protein [Chloroflexi bacterium]|nr:aspartate aminotransferase family protein [Chloroflexota bacterium]